MVAPLLFALLWFSPLPLEDGARRLAAIFSAVVVMWISEVLPIAVTALLVAPLMVVCGVADARHAFAPYADPLLFLFVGGFMIARAMTRHQLDRRIALRIVTLRFIGESPGRVRLGFMFTGVILSMWISNTATTAILVPILLGLLGVERDSDDRRERAVVGSLLALAYTCSIGGLGTPVGSPPNLIAMRFLRDAGYEIAFFDWVKVALPTALVMVGLTALVSRRLFPVGQVRLSGLDELAPQKHWTFGQRVTFAAFMLAVVGWMLPGVLKLVGTEAAGTVARHMPGGAVALVAASILFLFRTGGERVLPWDDAARIDWGIIMLFGGGISLGRQMFDTGLASALAGGIVEVTGVRGLWVLTSLVTFFTIFFTEACSNTATSNMLSPLVIAVARQLDVSPVPPVLAVGLAASCAFMLPIATGPNAVVYGTGRITVPAMMRAGFALNIACALVIIGALRLLCPLYGW